MSIIFMLDEAEVNNRILTLADTRFTSCVFPKPIIITGYALQSENPAIHSWKVDLIGGSYPDFYSRATFEKPTGSVSAYGYNSSGFATFPAGSGPSVLVSSESDPAYFPLVTLWYNWLDPLDHYLSNNLLIENPLFVYTASSYQSPQAPALVSTGNPHEYWQASTNANEWITVDMLHNRNLKVVGLLLSDSGLPENVQFLGSNDGSSFSLISSVTVANVQGRRQYFQINSTCRYFKMLTLGTWDSTAVKVNEISLYEEK
jgi:hypothetical protein